MGVRVDLAKIQVIRDWPAPTTLTELQSSLGLANFYRRFVLGFSHITWPLSQVTKGGEKEKFFWSKSQQRTFTELKLASALHQCSHYHTFNNHLISRQMSLTVLLGLSLLNRGIQWHITVRHFVTQSRSIPLMTKRCFPLYRPTINGSIIFWRRKRSST